MKKRQTAGQKMRPLMNEMRDRWLRLAVATAALKAALHMNEKGQTHRYTRTPAQTFRGLGGRGDKQGHRLQGLLETPTPPADGPWDGFVVAGKCLAYFLLKCVFNKSIRWWRKRSGQQTNPQNGAAPTQLTGAKVAALITGGEWEVGVVGWGRLASRRGHRQGNNVVRTIYMRCGKESQRINKDDMPTKQHIGAK